MRNHVIAASILGLCFVLTRLGNASIKVRWAPGALGFCEPNPLRLLLLFRRFPRTRNRRPG